MSKPRQVWKGVLPFCDHPCAWDRRVVSTPYLMITSETVGSWLKSEWMSVAALRKCRSRGPGVGGKLAAQQEKRGVKNPLCSVALFTEQEKALELTTDPGQLQTRLGTPSIPTQLP